MDARARRRRTTTGSCSRTRRPGPGRVLEEPHIALDVASSAADPDDPVSHTKIDVEPFYLNTAEIDPEKATTR